MSPSSEYRFPNFPIWLFVLMALAFGNGARIGEAATLWVPPADGMSESKVGRWAATENGTATFTFALPDDIVDNQGLGIGLGDVAVGGCSDEVSG